MVPTAGYQGLPNDEDFDTDQMNQEEEYLIIRQQSYPAADFKCPECLEDLEADARVLAAIRAAPKNVKASPDGDASDDAKLHEIKSFVKSPGVAGEKLLIFIESKVTADYLHKQLSTDNPGVNIDIVMSGDSRSARKVARFSPKSNDQPDLPEGEQTRILIATDVIAEGQNLQDCNRVISYDLHWSPVTLIQRFGRVDRITTQHEEIYLHNMMPDPTVEGETGIRERVSERVQSFHDLIGLDNVILENGEQVNPDSIYAIYDGEMPEENDDISDNLAVAQEANALLNRIRREEPNLWQQLWLMPDGLRAAMTAEGHPNCGATIALVLSQPCNDSCQDPNRRALKC